jgi:4-hydroxyacetophenone monooxygenase
VKHAAGAILRREATMIPQGEGRASSDIGTESDAELDRALADAHLRSLMAALVHLTGDPRYIRRELPGAVNIFGDAQAAIPADMQAEMRREAREAILAYRARGKTLPPPPSAEMVGEMMRFIAGQALPAEYIPLLQEELALDGEDTKAQSWLRDVPAARRAAFHVVIAGAGVCGLLAAIRLEQLGVAYTVVERNADVGGTWYANTYPGCRVDTPNHLYSFSFEHSDAWPEHFSTQDVLLAYLRRVAAKHGVRDRIRFETELVDATFDEGRSQWHVTLRGAGGETTTLAAHAVITAVGQLNQPKLPEIPGMESFAGPAFHSAAWDHSGALPGKRIAVVGTGASAFQIVPAIAPEAAELFVFQRSAPWLAPTPSYHENVPAGMRWLLWNVPFYDKWYRFHLFWMTADGLLPAVTGDPAWQSEGGRSVSAMNQGLRELLTQHLRTQVGDDPALFEAVLPSYPPGGKRMLRDNGVWLDALRRPNVHLVTQAIREIRPRGIVTVDGVEHAVDVIVYATGFHASRFLDPMRLFGRGGVELRTRWAGDARAYLGMTVPGYPNLFCMYGPNTNIVVNGSIIFFAECQIGYILGCLDLLLAGGVDTIECRPEVHDAFNAEIDAANARMAWGAPSVSSWYKNDKGRVSQNWPYTLLEYWRRTRAPKRMDFELR